MHTKAGPDFRRDINGLRAIAILIVVMFHMGLQDWTGGFVGVDVFFVISGYLIVPRVRDAFVQGNFSMLAFMAKRVRRLMPALLPVLVYVLGIGALILGDGAFDELMGSITAASGFVSNYFFVFTRGYFARSAEVVLLLHTWSLGVEFQFYLLIPLVFAVFRRWALSALVLLLIGSFVASVLLTQNDSNSAYYGITSRFWQLAVGGCLGIAQPILNRKLSFRGVGVLRAVGLGLILYSASSYTSQLPFPGFLALVPTLGAALAIVTPPSDRDLVARFLGSRPLGWLGSRSYAIYLWHWPLLKTEQLVLDSPDDGPRIIMVLCTFVLAELSYRLIETPIQQREVWKAARRTTALALVPVLACGAVLLSQQTFATISTVRSYLPMQDARFLRSIAGPSRQAYFDEYNRFGNLGEHGLCSLDQLDTVAQARDCLRDAPIMARTLFIGDSHARDLLWTFQRAFPEHPFHMLHQSSCAPATYLTCFPNLSAELPLIVQDGGYDTVVLVSHWPEASLEALARTFSDLAPLDVAVVTIGAGPVFDEDVPDVLFDNGRRALAEAPNVVPADFRFDVRASNIAVRDLAEQAGSLFVDRLDLLCETDACLAFVPGGRGLFYFDRQHLTLPAMDHMAEVFRRNAALVAVFD